MEPPVSLSTVSTIYRSSTTVVEVIPFYSTTLSNGKETVVPKSTALWSLPDVLPTPIASSTTSVASSSSTAERGITTKTKTTTTTTTQAPKTNIKISTSSASTSITTSQVPSTTSSIHRIPISQHMTSSHGLSNGAIIGIAIATAVVGCLIGFLSALIFARRRRGYRSAPQFTTYPERDKEMAISPDISDGIQLDQFLLEPKPDTILASELRSLGHLIQQHTENHYHLNPVRIESSMLRQPLGDLGIERGSAPAIARLASLVLEPRTRQSAIQYVIAKTAFESTVIGGSACMSLLPPMVSALGSSMPPVEGHVGNHQAVGLAITKWRQLSAFLLHPERSQRTPLVPSEDISTQQAQQLTLALNRFLEPFVSEDREERYEQENHLREVIVECAMFGYVIFSQPAEYRFRFDSDGGLDTIVVCPGLEKISDEQGHRSQSRPDQVIAPVIESI
ncbi:hypothetical protein GGS20DRAFT_115238 [Poronia punctata]|nr:hypothetical protein GGS20DRAFT_115238 [Poronia punctata]